MQNLQKFLYQRTSGFLHSPKILMPVMNPATEEQIGIVAMGNADDVNLAVSAANIAAFDYLLSNTQRNERIDITLKNSRSYKSSRL